MTLEEFHQLNPCYYITYITLHILNSNVNIESISIAKITRSKEYWSIGNSNQTEFDLENISEYYQHLTANVALNIV